MSYHCRGKNIKAESFMLVGEIQHCSKMYHQTTSIIVEFTKIKVTCKRRHYEVLKNDLIIVMLHQVESLNLECTLV